MIYSLTEEIPTTDKVSETALPLGMEKKKKDWFGS